MSRGSLVPGVSLMAMVQPSGILGSEQEMVSEEGSLGPRPQGTLQLACAKGSDFNSLGGILQQNQELQAENANLREAIRQSNQALKERCEELQEFQMKNRKEKELVASRFKEARTLVEQLRAANIELRRVTEGSKEEATGAWQQGGSANSSLTSYGTITQSLFANTAPRSLEDKPSDLVARREQGEGNEFVQLLKARKEELEKNLKSAQEENQLLRRKLEIAGSLVLIQDEKEEDNLLQRVTPKLSNSSSPGDAQRETQLEEGMSKLMVAENERSDLQQQLTLVQKRIVQFEHLEERFKRQEAELQEQKAASEVKLRTLNKQLEQMSEDQASLKAQVTSLLGELQDSQSCVEMKSKACSQLEQRCRLTEEKLRALELETENQKKQHSVTVDQLRIAVHSYESALKTERLNASEDKRKLAQLQAAYHQLFMDYDVMATNLEEKKSRGQVEELLQQLREAEEALVLKQDLIDKLKEDAETLKAELETIPVLKAQADVFKADFVAERKAREKLHEQKEAQQERLLALQLEYEKLRAEHEEATRYGCYSRDRNPRA